MAGDFIFWLGAGYVLSYEMLKMSKVENRFETDVLVVVIFADVKVIRHSATESVLHRFQCSLCFRYVIFVRYKHTTVMGIKHLNLNKLIYNG